MSSLKEQMIATASGLVVEPHDDEDSIKVNGIVLYRSGPKDEYGYVVGENAVCRVGHDFVNNGGSWVQAKGREFRPWVPSFFTGLLFAAVGVSIAIGIGWLMLKLVRYINT